MGSGDVYKRQEVSEEIYDWAGEAIDLTDDLENHILEIQSSAKGKK